MNDTYGTRSLREITRILFQHWIMLLLLVVLGGGGTYYVCERVAPRKYRSKISLIFKRPASKNPISSDSSERVLEVFVKAQQQIVMSDLVLARALVIADDARLRKQWYELRAQWEAAQPEAGRTVEDIQARIQTFLTEGEDRPGTVAHGVRRFLEGQQTQLNDFRKSVKLETPGGEQVAMTESFTITVDRAGADDPQQSFRAAAYTADLLADMYIVRYQELQQTLNDPALRVMQGVVETFEQELEEKRARYQEFIADNAADIGVLEQLLKSGTEHGVQVVLSKIRENDANLRLQLAREKAISSAMLAALPAGALAPDALGRMNDAHVAAAIDSVSVDFLKDNITYVELAKSIAALEGRKARLEAQLTDESRDVQYLREQISRHRRELLGAILAHVRGLAASIRAREEQLSMHQELVERTIAEQMGIHERLAVYARLKNDFEVAQKHLEKLQQEKIDAMSNRLRARESVTISKLDQASIPDPDRPVVPLTGIYTLVALAVSLLLGVAMAFLFDHFDHTLRSSTDAERYLGLPVLASIKRRGRALVRPM